MNSAELLRTHRTLCDRQTVFICSHLLNVHPPPILAEQAHTEHPEQTAEHTARTLYGPTFALSIPLLNDKAGKKMTTYTVTRVIQSVNIDGNEPVEVQFYKGHSHVSAIQGMVMAANTDDENGFYTVKSVHLTITTIEDVED